LTSEQELLDRAMHVFRRDGFAGASADVLVRETGASRYNLYSSYGSKEGLFAAALDRYNNEIISARFGPLEEPDADIGDVLGLLDFYGAAGSGPVAGLDVYCATQPLSSARRTSQMQCSGILTGSAAHS